MQPMTYEEFEAFIQSGDRGPFSFIDEEGNRTTRFYSKFSRRWILCEAEDFETCNF